MKKAIVIGASSDIGKELSKVLSEDAYIVGLVSRRDNLLIELQNELYYRYQSWFSRYCHVQGRRPLLGSSTRKGSPANIQGYQRL